jgi:hypothetical protein
MSDLPNGLDYNAMQLAIAWEMAKESTRLLQTPSSEGMLKALMENFIKAKYAIENDKMPKEQDL